MTFSQEKQLEPSNFLIQTLRCSILCVTESNVNWHQPQHCHAFQQLLQPKWQQSWIETSTTQCGTHAEHYNREYLPGGTLTIALDQWAAKVTKVSEDQCNLGCWSYMSMSGKHGTNITIITAYCICKSTNMGKITAACQQLHLLEEEAMQ